MEEQENFTTAGTSQKLIIIAREKDILEMEIFKSVLDQFYLNNFYPKPKYEKGRLVESKVNLA